MAKKSDIQYIRLYTSGSAALSVDFATPVKKPKTRLPKPRIEKKLLIRVDPVALCGILVAAVMLVLMVVGVFQFLAAGREVARLEATVARLEAQNAALRADYAAGYDLNAVKQMALALGLVPVSQVRHISIALD